MAMRAGTTRRQRAVLGAALGAIATLGVGLTPSVAQTAEAEPAAAAEALDPHIVDIYRYTAETAACPVPWTLLAGMGAFAADHGRAGPAPMLNRWGTVSPSLMGPVLDGTEGRLLVTDTDGGVLDGNSEFDRAVGPFQFIPATWRAWRVDGNGDGVADPNNFWDAARTATDLLCGNDVDEDVDAALTAYYGTERFNQRVQELAASIALGTEPVISTARTDHLWAVESAAEADGQSIRLTRIDEADEHIDAFLPDPATRLAGHAPVFGSFDSDGGLTAASHQIGIGGSGRVVTSAVSEADDDRGGEVALVDAAERELAVGAGKLVVGDWDGDGIDDVGTIEVSARGDATLLRNGAERSDAVVITRTLGTKGSDDFDIGDWDGDGIDSLALFRTIDGTVEFHMFDEVGRPYGPVIHLPDDGQAFQLGDWNGDGVDTVASISQTKTPELTIRDRRGEIVETRSLPAEVVGAQLVVGSVPLRVRAQVAVAPGLTESNDAAFFGPALAHDGSELELWRVRGILVEAQIADELLALLQAAEADGIELSGWGWRSHEAQIKLRESHCDDVWQTPASACTPPTAKPGTSRHEYGVAVDFTSNGSVLTWGSPAFEWMVANAGDFGFVNLPSEAWHWSVDGG